MTDNFAKLDGTEPQESERLILKSSAMNNEKCTIDSLTLTIAEPNEGPVSPTSESSIEKHSTFSDFSGEDSSCEESEDIYTIPKPIGVIYREDEDDQKGIKEDCRKGLKGRSQSIQVKISQNMKTVKNLGLDLMQDMKEKKQKFQSNIPRFKR